MKRLVFVTGSKNKFAEAASLLPGLVQRDIDLPEIQESKADRILTAKVEAARTVVAGDFFVEDVSLVFDALSPFPGPLIKWFVRDMGLEPLAALAQKLGNQHARATCHIGAWLDGRFFHFEGSMCGQIVAPRGSNGFGWDAIFCPEGSSLTFAEMDALQKQSYSMRALAIEAMKQSPSLLLS